jgi:3-deoxy-D-manno-octulosonate 8-phosphate phosphatase (KDO 8-P phosphatase)
MSENASILQSKLKRIQLLLLDVDGVLTRGDIIYDDNGQETKVFNVRDGLGLRLIAEAGIKVGVVTGRSSMALKHRCKNLGIEHIFDGITDKAALLNRISDQTGVSAERMAYVGDDLPDLPIMTRVGVSIAVSDACDIVRQNATVSFTVVAFYNYRRIAANPEELLSSIPGNANLTIGEIHQTATRDGIKEWVLHAASAQYIETKKQVILEELNITFFLKDQQKVFMTAARGILYSDSKNMEVAGDVVVKNANSRLDTEQLLYNHQNRLLLTKTPVEIIGESYKIVADSMSMDLNTNKTILEGKVKGTFSETFSL